MRSIASPQEFHAPPKYRPDIDGLRAVAVLLVIFDHLQFYFFSGGYVGVDVFFVISGYLIGTSMIAEFSEGGFSLASFYERRIRRILPALVAMLLIVTGLAYHFLMPEPFVAYAGSLIAAALSFSNFWFWHEAGYFANESAAKPLLHTWSLAVEEQFYICFPLLLFCVFRWWRRQLRIVLWAVAAFSFALAVWATHFDASMGFFWSPLRAWELLAGVLISQHSFRWLQSRVVREVVTLAAILFVVVPSIRYTDQTLFPGLTALLPCLGTALIIAAGERGKSAVAVLLSSAPFRFLGLISYSLYLWHWPILVFHQTRMWISDRPSWNRVDKLEILAFSIAMATLSWWFIEKPFRKGHLRLRRTPLFLLSASVTGFILCMWGGIIYTKGAPSRFSNEVVRVASFVDYDTSKSYRTGSCFLLPENTFGDFKPEECLNSIAGKRNYLLYGDSTVAQLYSGFSEVFTQFNFQQATAASCRPGQDQAEVGPKYRRNCQQLWAYIHNVYLRANHPDAVILGALWRAPDYANLQTEIQAFQRAGIPVVLLGPSIQFDYIVPLLLSAKMQQSGRTYPLYLAGHQDMSGLARDDDMARMAHDSWHVHYISYYKNLCDPQAEALTKSRWETTTGCPLFTSEGEPLMFDTHHLTRSASILFATTIRDFHELP